MAYKKRVYRFRNAIEVEMYHSGRYGAPGQGRQKKQKPTPEQMERKNQRNREDRCRRKMREHFRENDYYVTLTYTRDARPPDMEAAKQDFNRMIRRLRREYAGKEMKWIRNIEVGTKGAWHVHMVLNRIPDLDVILQQAWPHGRVFYQLLHQRGEFRDLAAYLTKTPKTDPRLKETSYSSSRNLPIPEPEEKVIGSGTWRKKIHIPEGWYLDQESYWEGINPVTGYPSRRYTLLRLPEDKRKSAGSGTYHRRC